MTQPRSVGYLGSKAQAGVFQRIISNMPPHSVYVEAFCGSGQIFRRKRAAAVNVLIDADAGVFQGVASDLTARAQRVIIGDAGLEIPKLALPDHAVVYCDPPYVHSTRTSRHGYNFEMTDGAHAALLTMLQTLKCRVLLSGYPSKLYDDMLRGWRCESYRLRTRGRTLTECLWCNFPPPVELHDWSYVGTNYRERLTLKRLADRFTARLARMPELKRNFILSLLQQRQSRRWDPNAQNDVAGRQPSSEMACTDPVADSGVAR